MTFPDTLLPAKVDLDLNGTWTDITTYVYSRDGIDIKRGTSDEGAAATPSSCSLTLDNRDGRFSPRNPVGSYYGLFGRNSKLRVSIQESTSWLQINQMTGNTVTPTYVATPDTAALDIVGDVDLRFEADLDSWRETLELIAKWVETGNQRSYYMILSSTGKISLGRSVDGSAVGFATSTVPVPITSGRIAVRATLDVDDGAGHRVSTFYVAPTLAGPWTQLGDSITTTGVIAIFSSSAPLRILDNPDNSFGGSLVHGRVIGAQVYNSSATLVANPDFSAQTEGATSFVDSTGKTWTLNGDLSLTKYDQRFVGEVSSWPTKWDTSGSDVYSQITAAGPLRRLNQGDALGSSLFRGLSRNTNLVGYWPMEDGERATSLASFVSTNKGITPSSTTDVASDSVFLCSEALPKVGNMPLVARLATTPTTTTICVLYLISVPSGGFGATTILSSVYNRGTAARWDLLCTTTGSLQIRAIDVDGVTISTSGAVAFGLNGVPLMVQVVMTNNGANVDWQISTYTPGSSTLSTTSGTVATNSINRVTSVVLNPSSSSDFANVTVGHLTVLTSSAFVNSLVSEVNAWNGEAADLRVKRLCEEEGVLFTKVGSSATTLMGPQLSSTLVALMKDVAEADIGQLYEARDYLGFHYRPALSLMSQQSDLTLDYAQAQLITLDPVEDDQRTRNDITVSRVSGGSARAQLTSGPLSVNAPPLGVARYDDGLTINVSTDDVLADQANFRVRLGTVDEARYPEIELRLESSHLTALEPTLARMDIGDRLSVTNPPAWLSQLEITQLLLGYSERLNVFERGMTLNCAPASPWDTAIFNDFYGQDRYASGGSLTNEALDTTETGVDVIAGNLRQRWTLTAANWGFKVLVGGELMTVTNVSGTGLTQTLTVTRSVNGVVKTHLTGQAIELAPLSYYNL